MTTHLITRESRTGIAPGRMLRAALFALALVVSPAWFAAGVTAAEITADNVAEHAASAKTSADYQALAAYYRSLAAEAAGMVKRHQKMLANAKKQHPKTYSIEKVHCEKIIGSSGRLQKDYEAMAAEYEKMAKGAQ